MTDTSPDLRRGPAQRAVEIGVAIGILLFGVLIMVGAITAGIDWGPEGPRAGFFPFYVGVAIVLASLFNLVRGFMEQEHGLFAEWGQLRQVLSVIVPTAIYVALIPWLGLYMASMVLIAVFMRWLGRYGWLLVASVAIGVPVVAYLMFEKWFLVPLPKGPIEEFLGL